MKLLGVGLASLAALSVGIATPAAATILTFDVDGIFDFQPANQGYGDRVVGPSDAIGDYGVGAEGYTANVVASYGSPGEAPALWTTGYGDLTNILFNDLDFDTTFTIDLSADAGFVVDLFSFDLAWYFGSDQNIDGFSVRDRDSGNTLFSSGSILLPGGEAHYDADFVTALSARNLSIVVDLTGLGGISDDVGIDNIRFGQRLIDVDPDPDPVDTPEPATLGLMLAGMGVLGGRLRRRRAAA